MNLDKKLIIITGQISSGKTTFLQDLVKTLSKKWEIDGLLSVTSKRIFKSGKPAKDYNIQHLSTGKVYAWATRKEDDSGYDFDHETRDTLTHALMNKHHDEKSSVLVIDDMGFLEIMGQGFDQLLREVFTLKEKTIIISAKKAALPMLIKRYSFEAALIVDLDELSKDRARKKILNYLYTYDSEKIAVFSALNSGVEIGLGSTLHALKIPLKGHFLASIQNLLLIQFGKELKGRNLFWIVLITACMKSFSPAGGKLRPMFYIFLQGFMFVVPIHLLGFNFLGVLIGSILMGQITLLVPFFMDYVIFGKAVINAYITLLEKGLSFLGIHDANAVTVLIFFIALKALIASFISATLYFNFGKRMKSLEDKLLDKNSDEKDFNLKRQSFKQSLLGALRDMTRLRFLIPFLFISILIYFFAGITQATFITTLFRGILLTWFGFLMARRIDFERIVTFLEKRELGYVAAGLKNALRMISKFQREERN